MDGGAWASVRASAGFVYVVQGRMDRAALRSIIQMLAVCHHYTSQVAVQHLTNDHKFDGILTR